LTSLYLETVKQAGKEYKQNGFIDASTQSVLDSLIVPREEYVATTNQLFFALKKQT
jgi:hypothetical protein